MSGGARVQVDAAPPEVLGDHETELVLLGTGGGPRPSLHRHPSAQLVRHGDRHIMVDCGNGVAHQCLRAGIDPNEIDDILVTHHHIDHTADLAVLPLTSWVNGRERAIRVAGPPPTSSAFASLLKGFAEDVGRRTASTGRPDFTRLVSTHDLTGADHLDDGPVRISWCEVNHPPFDHALAYRIDTPGGSVVVSGDTTPSDALIDLARDADVLVHEVVHPVAITAYERGTNASTIGRHLRENHTMIDQVGAVATEAGVGTLVLSHLVPHELEDEQWLDAVGGAFTGQVVVGRDLMRIRLSAGAGVVGPYEQPATDRPRRTRSVAARAGSARRQQR